MCPGEPVSLLAAVWSRNEGNDRVSIMSGEDQKMELVLFSHLSCSLLNLSSFYCAAPHKCPLRSFRPCKRTSKGLLGWLRASQRPLVNCRRLRKARERTNARRRSGRSDVHALDSRSIVVFDSQVATHRGSERGRMATTRSSLRTTPSCRRSSLE